VVTMEVRKSLAGYWVDVHLDGLCIANYNGEFQSVKADVHL
jgi:hypothetical protein